MKQPQPNEVWRTNSGRLCLIVEFPHAPADEYMMLWFDEIDGHWTVGEILDRLDTPTALTPQQFFAAGISSDYVTHLKGESTA